MKLRNYRDNPKKWRKFGKAPYYLGVELEVEAPSIEACDKGLRFYGDSQKDGQQALITKKDGSLSADRGWEIVTKPIAPNYWLTGKSAAKTFFDLAQGLRKLAYTSHENGNCGLHIHVSKSAFDAPSGVDTKTLGKPHYYWFARLVNSPLFFRLSQRKLAEVTAFCNQQPPKIAAWKITNSSMCWNISIPAVIRQTSYRPSRETPGRYYALNITDHTVEVRIFRGNLRRDRILKAIEAVIAGIAFARTRTSKHWKNNLENDFVAYVAHWQDRYPNLHHYLTNNLNMLVPEPEGEVILCAS